MERQDLERAIRMGARSLARAGLVHAYGHCSARNGEKTFLVCAARPMGTIGIGEDCVEVPIEGSLPDGVLGEVRVHQQIYRRRSDVGAICRVFPFTTLALSVLGVAPIARHGTAALLGPAIPLWSDVRLLRTDELAGGVAGALGDATAIVLKGNGAITVGPTLELATLYAVLLEESARIEEVVRRVGGEAAPLARLTDAEREHRSAMSPNIWGRMWDYLTFGDPERIDDAVVRPHGRA